MQNCVCNYTESQLCRALRTVQKAVLSKETARKEPGCMPFLSFPVHKNLHLCREKETGGQHSQCFSLISPQQLLAFRWQPLEAACEKCACNSVIDDDLKYENEHIQTFLLTRKEQTANIKQVHFSYAKILIVVSLGRQMFLFITSS